jgi:acyl-CoA synthetase (AMP-forming)/AMP-acid ligase II/thioesterase domain-containing protein/acyl carrier protein
MLSGYLSHQSRAEPILSESAMSVIPSLEQNSIGRVIKRYCELRPDDTAVVVSAYRPLTYGELQSVIEQIRTDLRMAGFGREARIAIAFPSGPHAALAIVAVACSCVAAPLNPKQTLAEVEACLSVLRPDAVLLLQGGDSAARRIAVREGWAIIEGVPVKGSILGLRLVAPPATAVAPADEPAPEGPAFILQTSGTTAEPKLIPFSHSNMLAAAARLRAWFGLSPQDRCLSVSPVFYSHGLKVTVFTPLLTGGTVAFPANASKFDYSEWFDALRPTWYSASPTLHRLIFDQTKSRTDANAMHSLRFVLSGGAPLPPDIREGLEHTLGVPVVEHYGSSEAAQISANLPPPGRSKPGTSGIPWPDTVMIVDENGGQLPAGGQGEILVCGPTVMSGYLEAPDLNQESFSNGWLRTGDIGSLDEEGFLTLHGRKKDLINRGGEKVWPIEVDNALMGHPAVAEAAAFAVPHPRLGEDVAAVVTLRPGMTTTPTELRKYLSERLTPFKVPRRISVTDQLPKGKTGKVSRRLLSETFGTSTVDLPTPVSESNDGLQSQLIEICERLLNISPVTLDDDFFEKGGDSLLALELLGNIEQLTGQKIPTSILFEATTVRKLAQKLSEADTVSVEPVAQISENGREVPLIFFHGDTGGGHYVKRLAKLLGSDQPIVVVAPHGLDGKSIPGSVEAMAADRFPLIMAAQPHGPYRLCGYCVGGLVAFEVARMLVAAGNKVEMVAMIDTPTISARRSVQGFFSSLGLARSMGGLPVERVIARLWYYATRIERLSNLPAPQQWTWVKTRLRTLVRSKNDLTDLSPSDMRYQAIKLSLQNEMALSRYCPAPLSVPVIHFSVEFDPKAWRRISPELEIIKLTGDHYGVVADPANLAEKLRSRLQRATDQLNP